MASVPQAENRQTDVTTEGSVQEAEYSIENTSIHPRVALRRDSCISNVQRRKLNLGTAGEPTQEVMGLERRLSL